MEMTTTAEPRLIRDYDDLIEELRARKAALGVTDKDFEAEVGLAGGHLAKIIGDAPAKHLGPRSLELILAGLRAAIVIVDDPEPVKINFERRQRPPQNGKHVSRAALERARPILEPIIISERSRANRRKQLAMQASQHRERIARQAAKKRWAGRKVPRKRRLILARAAQRARERRQAKVAENAPGVAPDA
ncbi:MAG: hypothetical protein IT562_10775 [Alphaproteobacteria bacterium]|nr:hypothetical protein [Alphaproteobacteria bacterium]